GAAVSATSTSPLGSVYTQRGCDRPVANALTATPSAGVGFMPGGQPLASATCTTGMVCLFGSGSCGLGPTVADGDVAGPVLLVPGNDHAHEWICHVVLLEAKPPDCENHDRRPSCGDFRSGWHANT